MRAILFPLILCAVSFAQVPTPAPVFLPRFPESLKIYLGLNDTQITRILQFNTDYFQFEQQKNARAAQVQGEIALEIVKPSLDPMSIGLRYVELEAIRRELTDRRKQLSDNLQGVLTADQRTKLKTLTEAMALQPVIAAAQCENLLPQQPPFPANVIPASRISPIGGILIGTILPQFSCTGVEPFPGPLVPVQP
jgi:hypothetical protein